MISIKIHKQTTIIFALVIINFLVKGMFMSSNSLAGDEPFSVYHAQMNTASIIKLLSEGNNPPLYEILLHFWIKIFGITEFSVRFPSLIFSCLTVLVIYKLGIKYLNSRVALSASIIFIFSNYHILFAHEARVYAFLGLLTVISMYLFMGIFHDDEINNESGDYTRLKNKLTTKFILLAIVNTLIIYSHYFGFFVLLIQFLFLLFNFPFLVKHWKKVFLSASIIALLYSPFILLIFNRFIASSGGTWVQAPTGFESIYNMLWVFSNAPVVAVCCITLLVFSLLKYLTHFKNELNNIHSGFVIFWFGFIFFFMFGVSYWIPMFMDRYLMPAAIAYPLLVGICADYLIKTSNYRFVIPVVISLLFVVTVKPNMTNKRNVRETVEKIKALKTNRTIVYFCPDYFELNFAYYYNIEYFKDYDDNNKNNIYQHLHSENIFPINSFNQIDTNLINLGDKLIYLDASADFSYPNNNIKIELDLNFHLKNQYNFHEVFSVFEYELK